MQAEYDRVRVDGSFHRGPGPAIKGFEALGGEDFAFVCGPLFSQSVGASQTCSLHYARKQAWLGFPSLFTESSEKDDGPWSMYQTHRMYPFTGMTLLDELGSNITASAWAMTNNFDPRELPFHWKEPPPAREYDWVKDNTSWHYQRNEEYTSYEAGLVIVALHFDNNHPVLCLFTAHDGKLVAANTYPFGRAFSKQHAIKRLAFSPQGWMLAAITADGQLHIFHTKTLTRLRHFPQIDSRCDPREVALRMEWNSRGDKFLAYHQNDLVEVDVIMNRVQRLSVPVKVNAYCYVDSYDHVDTVLVASQENGAVYKFRLDGSTLAREERFAVAGLSPLLTYLNFSLLGDKLVGVACESTRRDKPLQGKTYPDTEVRLLIWDLDQSDRLDEVPSLDRTWRLKNGKLIVGRFVQMVCRPDGWHVIVNHRDTNLIDISSAELTKESIDTALLLSSLVQPPQEAP